VVDPLACDGRLQIAGLHISPPGQLRHQGYPNTQPLPPLMFKQTALDFGQGQDRWHGKILPPTLVARNSLFLMLGFVASGGRGGFGLAVISSHGL
jgi:hypothetical protein